MIGRFFTGKVLFSIKKARKMLEDEPEVEFAKGMREPPSGFTWMKL